MKPKTTFSKIIICITALVVIILGCSKNSDNFFTKANEADARAVTRFLTLPANASPELMSVAANMKQTEEKYHFLAQFIKAYGTPVWDKTQSNLPVISNASISHTQAYSSDKQTFDITPSIQNTTGVFFIPLIDSTTNNLNSYVVCTKVGDTSFTYHVVNKQTLLSYPLTNYKQRANGAIQLGLFGVFENSIHNQQSTYLPSPYNVSCDSASLNFNNTSLNSILNQKGKEKISKKQIPSKFGLSGDCGDDVYILYSFMGFTWLIVLEQECCSSSLTLVGMYMVADAGGSGSGNPGGSVPDNTDPGGSLPGSGDPAGSSGNNTPIFIPIPSTPVPGPQLPDGWFSDNPNNSFVAGPNTDWTGFENEIPTVISLSLENPDPEFVEFPANNSIDQETVSQNLRCFSNSPNCTYSITVNINQPTPGTRDLRNTLNEHAVGHTYLTLDQTKADGTHIIRNVGFYLRSDKVNLISQESTSGFGDDSNVPASVSLEISVSGSEFMTEISNLINLQTTNYNLSTFNCTTAVITTLNTINIDLPKTRQSYTGWYTSATGIYFYGYNAGDLGEDIRTMDLAAFKIKTNKTMKLAVSNTNSITAKPKTGVCP